jgi:hypothetical protein
MDKIYLDDGKTIRKKTGKVDNIKNGLVYFFEHPSSEFMIIPITRIIKIIRYAGGGSL